MDRLSSLIWGLFLVAILTGCGEGGGASGAAPPGRVVAVSAEVGEDPAERFCDVRPEDAPRLRLPALAEGEVAPELGGRRWLNVWATWCAPCIEEMPRIQAWRERLGADGVPTEMVWLSADEDEATIATFREAHPDTPVSLRIADPALIAAWAPSVGLDEGATLPIHVFTGADGRVTCARTGGVGDDDYDGVRAALR